MDYLSNSECFPEHEYYSENFFGQTIVDRFKILEDLNYPQTRAWLANQRSLADNFYLKHDWDRQAINDALLRLWRYPKYSVVSKEGPYYFYWGLDLDKKQTIPQNQAVLYCKKTLVGPSFSVIDPNELDPLGNLAVTYQSFSPDGEIVAYAVSARGSDQQSIFIRYTQSQVDFPEVLEGCKTVNVAWDFEKGGFYYNRAIIDERSSKRLNCIFFHRPGTPQSEDSLIFRPDSAEAELEFYPEISGDSRFFILYASRGTEPFNLIYYRDLHGDGHSTNFQRLDTQLEARYIFIGNRQTTLYFQTDWQAPGGQVIAVDTTRPQFANWQMVIPQDPGQDILAFGILAGDQLVAVYLHDAHHRIKVFSPTGQYNHEIPLPQFCTIFGLCGKPASQELFIGLESFLQSPLIYYYDLAQTELKQVFKSEPGFDAAAFETRQIRFPSKDGTLISMFIVQKKETRMDGNNPVLMTGYGGFGISQTPLFLISQTLMLERGCILAVPNVRGGGEYGAGWHEQGRLANKQHSFDDFCAAAEWLIAGGYTRPARLGIMGHSNGGLLVAGALAQKPHLFGAVVSRAPLTDMLNYHRFGAGRNWVAEYGCAETSEAQLRYLLAYSPLHNLQKVAYPATLVTVPLHDERVHPMHSLKFMAGLQTNSTGEAPLILRVSQEGGHGLGNSASLTIEELSDIFTFLFSSLKIG